MGRLTRALLFGAAAVMLAAAACTTRDARGRYDDTIAQAVPRIEQAVGLKYKTPPVLQERTKAEVRAFVERELADTLTQHELIGRQSAYKILGIIPDSLDLRKLTIDLLTEQVSGFYDPRTKVLYVVKGAPREETGLVVWHELVHALQDQYVNTDSLLHQRDNDRVSAASALLEGEATIESLHALAGADNVRAADAMFSNWDKMRETIRQNKQIMPAYSAAPQFIQETLLFPYMSGAEFVRQYKERNPGKAPFANVIPASTEQIISREAYFGKQRDEPIAITLPAPKSGTASYQDNFGEFEMRVMLFVHLQSQDEAVPAAAGWGGDQYMIVRTPKGDGLVWLSMWDSAIDAAEFTSALRHVIGVRFPDAKGVSASGGFTRWDTYARSLALYGGDIAGHPTVMLLDVPKGTSTDLIDLSTVRVSR